MNFKKWVKSIQTAGLMARVRYLGILYCVVGRSEGLAPLSFSAKQLTLSQGLTPLIALI